MDPDHANANYALGEALLEPGDEAGIRHIEVAMEKEVHVIPHGCELIYDFLTARKRADEADRYRRCIIDYYEEAQLAQDERHNVSTKDHFKYHELAPESIRELREQLRNYPDLATAHLVQKVVQHFPEESLSYVLGVTLQTPVGTAGRAMLGSDVGQRVGGTDQLSGTYLDHPARAELQTTPQNF